ncbi:class I SAM-dependent methyltransferase [Candidatus Chloroploca sp. M-50]|uniref:Class I SAM-dependent methyltransferase n=1 Tax=Candidatus Chloroploca mongolica TaxID=2528176 RepID=A0ABS4DBQ2_9CHLR|nr:class I SAM-dependent methyltransferase [Candidatus Chloroploca mongolica]MBP1466873.1 class I SAM-dependent methyltransferase [Candidatus Chloroploca mongolica]
MQRQVLAAFVPGQSTVDVGCGSGRDTAWLVEQGFPTVGYDGSIGMVAAARAAYPELDLRHDTLPHLATIPDESYTNVLCSAVLMHLPSEALAPAVAGLARIMRPGGRLVLTYRASETPTPREPDGRLYTPIDQDELAHYCAASGLCVLRQDIEADGGRAGVHWSIVVAERLSQA